VMSGVKDGKESKDVILVVGGTGGTGKAIVKRLLALDPRPEVRVLARNVTDGKKALGDDVHFFAGDVADEKAVVEAMKGVTRVIYAVGPSTKEFGKSTEPAFVWGLRNVINIGKKGETLKQIVLLGAALVTRPWHPVAVVVNTAFGMAPMNHLKQEKMIRESGFNYIVVRPVGLGSADAEVEQIDVSQGDTAGGSFISRAAVAETIVRGMFDGRIPQKVSFEVWGKRGTQAGPGFDWGVVWRKLKEDFDPLPDVEASHGTARLVYGVGLLATVAGAAIVTAAKCLS